ncbi:MAG: hypothetical protein J1F64_08870 [Oscillospiraceae bacterium]|nr:hypothetical protein [Oscillospiraceae bacterium]
MQDNIDKSYKDELKLTEEVYSSGTTPYLSDEDEVLEMGDDFDFSDFQVVRREFFANLREPSLTFNQCRIYVNTACLAKFSQTEYVQLFINRNTKILALRPCEEGTRDSFPWCYESKGKRKPKHITCKLFFAKIFTLMEWNPDFHYKLLGTVIRSKGEYLLAFDLSSTEVYQKTFADGEKPKSSRTPVFPSSWKNQFGLPFYEHRQSLYINIFEGYAIYSIKDNSAQKAKPPSVDLNSKNNGILLPATSEDGGVDNG